MKKLFLFLIFLIITGFQLSAQKTKDVLYLKNGNMIYGKLIEVYNDQFIIQTSDGIIKIYQLPEVEKFAKEAPLFEGRKVNGFGFALEAGLLVGSKQTKYVAPFSFNFLAGITGNTKSITSIGSGVEFIGRPFTPIFLEYKYIFYNRKTSPFFFARGGAIIPLGGNEESSSLNFDNNYVPFDYKGGVSIAFGSGISWTKEDYETYLSFGYRYAHTSYVQKESTRGNVTYSNSLNRLEIKFGYKF